MTDDMLRSLHAEATTPGRDLLASMMPTPEPSAAELDEPDSAPPVPLEDRIAAASAKAGEAMLRTARALADAEAVKRSEAEARQQAEADRANAGGRRVPVDFRRPISTSEIMDRAIRLAAEELPGRRL